VDSSFFQQQQIITNELVDSSFFQQQQIITKEKV
jgi:hypothetical protein